MCTLTDAHCILLLLGRPAQLLPACHGSRPLHLETFTLPIFGAYTPSRITMFRPPCSSSCLPVMAADPCILKLLRFPFLVLTHPRVSQCSGRPAHPDACHGSTPLHCGSITLLIFCAYKPLRILIFRPPCSACCLSWQQIPPTRPLRCVLCNPYLLPLPLLCCNVWVCG